MIARFGIALGLLAFAACPLWAQTVTILDENGQPVEVAASQFQTVGPHPGVIDVDHLHALNGFAVVGLINQFVRDPSPDPGGRGYILANNPGPQPGPQDFSVDATVSVGVVSSDWNGLPGVTINDGCGLTLDSGTNSDYGELPLLHIYIVRNEIQDSSGGETKPSAPTGKEGEKPPSK